MQQHYKQEFTKRKIFCVWFLNCTHVNNTICKTIGTNSRLWFVAAPQTTALKANKRHRLPELILPSQPQIFFGSMAKKKLKISRLKWYEHWQDQECQLQRTYFLLQ